MANNNPKRAKAQSAMDISLAYADVLRLKQIETAMLHRIEKMVESENHPDFDSAKVRELRLAVSESDRQDIAIENARWHNVAYDRGYFETEAQPRKLSKSNQ